MLNANCRKKKIVEMIIISCELKGKIDPKITVVWPKARRICSAGFIFACEYTEADGVDGWADGELLNKAGVFSFPWQHVQPHLSS